jgi:hypothetical protein
MHNEGGEVGTCWVIRSEARARLPAGTDSGPLVGGAFCGVVDAPSQHNYYANLLAEWLTMAEHTGRIVRLARSSVRRTGSPYRRH